MWLVCQPPLPASHLWLCASRCRSATSSADWPTAAVSPLHHPLPNKYVPLAGLSRSGNSPILGSVDSIIWWCWFKSFSLVLQVAQQQWAPSPVLLIFRLSWSDPPSPTPSHSTPLPDIPDWVLFPSMEAAVQVPGRRRSLLPLQPARWSKECAEERGRCMMDSVHSDWRPRRHVCYTESLATLLAALAWDSSYYFFCFLILFRVCLLRWVHRWDQAKKKKTKPGQRQSYLHQDPF